jgi:hypothetical protein
VKNYTRETNKSATTIDLVFTNDENIKCYVDNVNNITDHNMIYIRVPHIQKNDSLNYKCKEIWSWRNYSMECLVDRLFNVDWQNFDNCDDLNDRSVF